MALINRISRLFTADMHAVIDRMEEPEILLRQALRDMEAAVTATEQRARRLARQAEELSTALERAVEARSNLEAELDVCLDADNDDLARAVLRRKLQTEQQISNLGNERTRVEAERQELDHALAGQRMEIEELEQKARLFDVVGTQAATMTPPTIAADDVEVALLKAKQRRAAS